MLDLQPIKDRLAAATAWPWDSVFSAEYRGIKSGNVPRWLYNGATLADGALVANAPTDLAALVAEVERLRGLLDEHRMADRLQTSEVFND